MVSESVWIGMWLKAVGVEGDAAVGGQRNVCRIWKAV